MKRLVTIPILFVLLFANSSSGVIPVEKSSPVITSENSVNASEPVKKSVFELSKKELRKISVADMEKVLGRKMTSLEKTAYKLNKKKFVEYTKMAEDGKTNTMAIVGFVCSLVIAPLGLIFGLIALGQIKKRGEKGRGWALAAVIIGAVFTVIGIISLF
jgi:Domain of unknown function (DUF4190)